MRELLVVVGLAAVGLAVAAVMSLGVYAIAREPGTSPGGQDPMVRLPTSVQAPDAPDGR